MTLKKNGVNFSNIFEPKGSATKISNVGFKEGGSDISNLYYPLSLGGTSPANTNYKKNGIDLAALFASKGSVSYFTFGSETVFNSEETYDISVTKLDDTHVCIAYVDDAAFYDYGTAIIGTVTGNSITFGTKKVFGFNISNTSITTLDDTHVCIAYKDNNNSFYGTAIIGTISGNSITFGSERVFNTGTTYYISITKLDDTHVCIAYADGGNSRYGTAIIGTISGNYIYFGSERVFNSEATHYISITTLDTTHVCIAYADGYYTPGTAIIGTRSGTSIYFGSERVFYSGATYDISITKLDDTHVCIAYQNRNNDSYYGIAIIGTISGNYIYFGSKTVFNSGTTYNISITKLDDTHVYIACADYSNSGYGTAIIGTISGNSITFESERVFNSGNTYDISVIKLDDTHVCIAYEDHGNSDKGTAIIGSF